jgi:fluoroacetyl-CoA thioesterase
MSAIAPGLLNETSRRVEERHLACEWGSGLAAVLATPVLVAFCEECARLAVDPLLPAGQETVGTWISLRHLAATPPGLQVTVRAELREVDGRRLRFHVEAWDEVERVGEAEHERLIIDVQRFQQRLVEKAERVRTSDEEKQAGTD